MEGEWFQPGPAGTRWGKRETGENQIETIRVGVNRQRGWILVDVVSACGEVTIPAQIYQYTWTHTQMCVQVLNGYHKHCLQFSILSYQRWMWPFLPFLSTLCLLFIYYRLHSTFFHLFHVMVFMLPKLEDWNFSIQEQEMEALMISIENSCLAYSHCSNLVILLNTHYILSSQIYSL